VETAIAGGAYSVFDRLEYRVHSEPTRHESPFLSVHRARTVRGRLGQGCLYWDPEGGSPPPKHGRQEDQDNGVRK
jgi:hypothetical protein